MNQNSLISSINIVEIQQCVKDGHQSNQLNIVCNYELCSLQGIICVFCMFSEHHDHFKYCAPLNNEQPSNEGSLLQNSQFQKTMTQKVRSDKKQEDDETTIKINVVDGGCEEKVKPPKEVQEIQSFRDDCNHDIDGYLKTIDELTNQLKQSELSFSSVQITLNEIKRDSETLKIEIKQQEETINQQIEIIKSLEEKGDINLKTELQKYQEMIRCPLCKNQQQKIILSKCNHLFCKQCIENNIQNRNRKCPKCLESFSVGDIKEIFWF